MHPIAAFSPLCHRAQDADWLTHMQGQREEDHRDEFGVWSLGWAQDGQTIIAGTGNESVYVYDANIRRVCSCGS